MIALIKTISSKHKTASYMSGVYAILLITFHRWFLPGYFANGDTGLLKGKIVNDIYSYHLWKGYHDLGTFYVEAPFLLINFISSLPTRLFNLEYNAFTIKVLFFYPYLILAPLGIFLLVKKLTKSHLASFIAALIYTINTPNIISFAMGHLHVLMPFIFLPFIFLYTLEYLEDKNSQRTLLLVNLFFLLSNMYEFRFFYLSFLWFSILLLCSAIMHGRNHVKRILCLFISVVILAVIFNLYWLLPSLLSSINLSNNPILNRAVFGGEYLTVLNSLTLSHPYWTPTEIAVFTKQNIPLIFFLFPIYGIWSLWLNRRNKYIYIFFILLLIGVLLTKQYDDPFSSIYQTLYNYLPGFKLFRESTKFFQVVTFAYALLIGYFIAFLQSQKMRWQMFTVIGSLLCILLLLVKPILTGEAKTLFTPIEVYDKDYIQLNAYLQKQNTNSYFRILWIPSASNLSTIKDTMPHLHQEGLLNLWAKTLETKHKVTLKTALQFFTFPEVNQIIDMYSVKYIIVPKGNTTMDGNVFYWHERREKYEKVFNKLPYLKRIDIGNDKIALYENTNYHPHFFTTTAQNLQRPFLYKEIVNQLISPVQYTIHVSNLSEKTNLVFTEAYASDWNLRVGDFNWVDSLTNKNYFIEKRFHKENTFATNTFVLDPVFIKEHADPNTYQINKDGSIELKATMYYQPQAYLNIGAIISIATVLMGTSYLGITFLLKRKAKSYENGN